MVTKVWLNHENGSFAVESHDGFWLGANKIGKAPAWAARKPDHEFEDMIEWDGGGNPVSEGETVLCRFRSRGYYFGVSNPHSTFWRHAPAPGRPNTAADVVSYQVVTDG